MLHFSKTARNFFIILSLRKVNNISLHMNLVSQLAALVCQPGVHRNIENKSGDLATFWQKLPGHDILDVIFLQNGSKFFREKVSWKISSRFGEIWHLRYHVLEAFAKMSPDHLICVPCFYGCQADKPARPIGWLGSCVRKYCLLCAGKVLWKNFEPFWRNVTSKIVFSCMFLSIYCYERLFAVTDVSMNANRTN